jgi:hypothetical protein
MRSPAARRPLSHSGFRRGQRGKPRPAIGVKAGIKNRRIRLCRLGHPRTTIGSGHLPRKVHRFCARPPHLNERKQSFVHAPIKSAANSQRHGKSVKSLIGRAAPLLDEIVEPPAGAAWVVGKPRQQSRYAAKSDKFHSPELPCRHVLHSTIHHMPAVMLHEVGLPTVPHPRRRLRSIVLKIHIFTARSDRTTINERAVSDSSVTADRCRLRKCEGTCQSQCSRENDCFQSHDSVLLLMKRRLPKLPRVPI